jgi:hypothetical protein
MKTETHQLQLPGQLTITSTVEFHDDRIIVRVSYDEWDDPTEFFRHFARFDQWMDEIAAPYVDDPRPVNIYGPNVNGDIELWGQHRR